MQRRRLPLLIVLLALVTVNLHAQYGAVLAAAAAQDPLSVGAALRLLGTASGSVAPELSGADVRDTLGRLRVRVPVQADASPITLGEFCYLMSELFDLREGAVYGLVPGPRAAFEELYRRGMLDSHARAGQTISGADALLLLHRVVSRAQPGSASFTPTPTTFAWGGALSAEGQLADLGAGPVLDTQDILGLGISVAHGLGPGVMTYQLGAAAGWLPQSVAAGQSRLAGLSAYPAETGLSFELIPLRAKDIWMKASLGRLDLPEPTGLLLYDPTALHPAQMADGLLLELRYLGFYVSAGAGYLGLLEERLNRVRFTPQDTAELSDPFHYFAPPRGLGVLRLEADRLLFAQSMGLFGIGQLDFRTAGQTFDSWYVGTTVSGPIAAGFRQETSLVVAFAEPSAGSPGVGMLLSVTGAYRIPVSFLHETWLSVLWASGASGGLAAFPQLAGPPAGSAFAVPLTDLVRIETGIDSDLVPGPGGAVLTPAFKIRLLLSPDGQIPAGFSFQPVGSYIGTEVELSATYHPLDDIGISALAGGIVTTAGFLPYVRIEAGVEL